MGGRSRETGCANALLDEASLAGVGGRLVELVVLEGVGDRAVLVGLGDELVETIEAMLPSPNIDVTVLIPYERGDLVSKIYALGMVEHEEHGGEGTAMQAKVPADLAAELADFRRPDLVIGE